MTTKDPSSEIAIEASRKPASMSPFVDNQVYFATCSPRKARAMKKRHYNVSPDGVSSLDEYTTTITYETNTPTGGGRTRRMSITISDGNSSSEMSSEPAVIAESLETSSLATQSTNCSRTTASPLPSPSSGLSLATTASCKKSFAMAKNLMKHETFLVNPSSQYNGLKAVTGQSTEEFVQKNR